MLVYNIFTQAAYLETINQYVKNLRLECANKTPIFVKDQVFFFIEFIKFLKNISR